MVRLSEKAIIETLTQAYKLLLVTPQESNENDLSVAYQIALMDIYPPDSSEYLDAVERAKMGAVSWYVQLTEPLVRDGRDFLSDTGEHPVILAGAPSELVRKWGTHYDNCDDCQHAHFCAVGKNIIVAMGRYLDANPYTIGAMSINQ